MYKTGFFFPPGKVFRTTVAHLHYYPFINTVLNLNIPPLPSYTQSEVPLIAGPHIFRH